QHEVQPEGRLAPGQAAAQVVLKVLAPASPGFLAIEYLDPRLWLPAITDKARLAGGVGDLEGMDAVVGGGQVAGRMRLAEIGLGRGPGLRMLLEEGVDAAEVGL